MLGMLGMTVRTSETFPTGSINGFGLFSWLRRMIVNRVEKEAKPMHAQLVTGAGRVTEAGALTQVAELGGNNMLNWQAVKGAVEQLPLNSRVVFRLHDIFGYKHEEIANRLGISVSTSKSQLHDARLQLRTLLFQN